MAASRAPRLLGRIIHKRSPLGIRQAWHIEDAVGQCSAVARYRADTGLLDAPLLYAQAVLYGA
ncbi:hypothetical protein AB0952_31895 [Streptomyces caniferus]|uniref:hypothetical protein n=1 Tax=Streptomyces caniferus TaxID=285557 RepID=UPI0033F26339